MCIFWFLQRCDQASARERHQATTGARAAWRVRWTKKSHFCRCLYACRRNAAEEHAATARRATPPVAGVSGRRLPAFAAPVPTFAAGLRAMAIMLHVAAAVQSNGGVAAELQRPPSCGWVRLYSLSYLRCCLVSYLRFRVLRENFSPCLPLVFAYGAVFLPAVV